MVYKILCAACPAAYIGQTGRRLCQCLGEHKRAVKDADFNSSALAEHAWTKGHPIDGQSASVLSSCPDYHYRLVKEAILIRTTSVLIRDTGTLPPEYDNLIKLSNTSPNIFCCHLLFSLSITCILLFISRCLS